MIKSVRSNLKGTRPQDFQSAYVLLLGKNGAGKSRLAHAIELALCGQVVDMAGKDVKLKRRLWVGRHSKPERLVRLRWLG